MGFFSRLEARARQAGSLLCVGLDPHGKELPEQTAAAARDFCLRLIEATADTAAAFKPNAAFFERFGAPGWQALQQVIAAVPDGIPVILDAKRGDIASTAQAYAEAAFQALGADCLTASPYLGRDSLEPLLADPDRGVFALCKTSNPGAGDVQDLPLAGLQGGAAAAATVYEAVAALAVTWNRHDNLGLVAGATHPVQLARIRQIAPQLWILAPGVGAQGGDLEAALRAGLRADGLGLLLPVSRAISAAPNPRQAAEDLNRQINHLCQEIAAERSAAGRSDGSAPAATGPGLPVSAPQTGDLQALADGLLDLGCVKFGSFTLKSGLQSPVYLDLRQLVSRPALLEAAGRAYVQLLRGLSFDRLAALPYAALPIGTAVSLLGGWPLIYPRKETKEYGTKAAIEGLYQPGERIVIIDDLATTGGSKFEAIEKMSAAGLQVQDVVVLIDRQSGAAEALAAQGYRLHAVLHFTALLDYWQAAGRVDPDRIDAARQFIRRSRQG